MKAKCGNIHTGIQTETSTDHDEHAHKGSEEYTRSACRTHCRRSNHGEPEAGISPLLRVSYQCSTYSAGPDGGKGSGGL